MKKRWLVLLCVLVLLVAGGLWWNSLRPVRFPGPLVLADGNRVHLVGVTLGTNATMHFGTGVERVMARLPGKLGSRFRGNQLSAVSHTAPGEDIVLWFRYDRPPQPNTYLRARLQNGERLFVPSFSAHPQTLSNGQTVAYCGTELWPRRSRTLTFQVEEALQSSHEAVCVGELTVANPGYGDYPVWVPEELPATRIFKDTGFALDHPNRPHHTRLRVTSDGWPDTRWEVWRHWVRDATGNIVDKSDQPWSGPVRESADERGVITLPLLGHGMPEEPAWKVGLQFVRAKALASNDVFVLREVPAVSTGAWFSAIWKTNLPAGSVQLRYQLDWEDDSRRPCLVPAPMDSVAFGNSRPVPLAIMILAAVSDSGTKIEPVNFRKIHIPPGSATLDITIGIPQQHLFEYTVDPKLFREQPFSPQPMSTPAYLKIPESIHPEKILRELGKK